MEWRARSSTRRILLLEFHETGNRDRFEGEENFLRPNFPRNLGRKNTILLFSFPRAVPMSTFRDSNSFPEFSELFQGEVTMIIEFERKRNRSIDLVHHFFPTEYYIGSIEILIKIGATNVKGLFLIRRVLFVEFNEQIRRWLSSSSSSPFDDRYHFGSTLRYNRETFYFILFFFLPFFSILFLLSGEKNGWKPLSAIVGIWTDS